MGMKQDPLLLKSPSLFFVALNVPNFMFSWVKVRGSFVVDWMGTQQRWLLTLQSAVHKQCMGAKSLLVESDAEHSLIFIAFFYHHHHYHHHYYCYCYYFYYYFLLLFFVIVVVVITHVQSGN
jgi:hypothetical protein